MNQPMINKPMEVIVGLAVTIVLGFGVGRLLDKAAPYPTCPSLMKEEDWNAIAVRSGHGDWLGFFERLLSFLSFAISEYTILGGWLAFKLATKWEVWKNIVQVPANMEGISPLAWYQARKAFGSWVLARFLIGTLVNVIIGVVGLQSGKLYCKYVSWLCS